MTLSHLKRAATPAALMLLLSGCAVGPNYERPTVEVPVAFKEESGWTVAEPQEAMTTTWWLVFQDPLLDELESQVEVSNQTLKAADAAYRESLAAIDAAIAGFFPTIIGTGTAQRARSNVVTAGVSSPVYASQYTAALGGTWVPDLWGKVRRMLEGAEANANASAADLAGVRLTVQTALALNYIQLRSLDQLKRLLDDTAIAYERTLQIVTNQYNADIVTKADVLRADTQLKTTQSQAVNVQIQRAQLEHAIAVLIGKPPAEFSIPVGSMPVTLPQVPLELPSTLLQRRPDISAAQWATVNANAQIGVAKSAYFPSLTLTGSTGFTGSMLDKLFRASNYVWALGAGADLTIFDGGLISAQVAEARAAYDITVANYRQTVLTGFQQVEDQLAAIRILAEQSTLTRQALESAREAEQVILNQYKAGVVDYTTVATAQTAALLSAQQDLAVQQNRLTATVSLIEALGGGWNAIPE